jgi:hypothetical protein
MLIHIPSLWPFRAQYILADNMGTSHLGTPDITELGFYYK